MRTRFLKLCGPRTNYILLAALCLAGCELSAAHAEAPVRKNAFAVLDRFSESVQALSAQVAPSVVQISVTRYAPREERASGRIGVVLGRQQSVGSGVVVDADGYIVTNAHVVEGAQRIKASLVAPALVSGKSDQLITNELAGPSLRLWKQRSLAFSRRPISRF